MARYVYMLCGLSLWLGCGEGPLAVSDTSYEPKLVIEGVLRPGVGVEGIRITRNLRVDEPIRSSELIPSDVRAAIVDLSNGQSFALKMRSTERVEDRLFSYEGVDLRIVEGGSYALSVEATVEGQTLRTYAVTTVPEAGFRIVSLSDEELPYRPLDERGEPMHFSLDIARSPSSNFYLITARPRVATSANFIYDNPLTQQSRASVERDLADFNFRWDWIQNTPSGPGLSTIKLLWFYLWFYGEYDIVVYAADEQYARFIQTHDRVQEADGNFHSAAFSIEGDGIGYFGSALVDSVQLRVLR